MTTMMQRLESGVNFVTDFLYQDIDKALKSGNKERMGVAIAAAACLIGSSQYLGPALIGLSAPAAVAFTALAVLSHDFIQMGRNLQYNDSWKGELWSKNALQNTWFFDRVFKAVVRNV